MKNKYVLAFICGALCVLAFAPLNLFAAAVFSISCLYFILEKVENKRQAFCVGLCFGYGHFLFGIYWIAISLLVDAQKFAWLIPFALTIIPAALAVYIGCFAWCYKKISVSLRFTYEKILLFAILWLFFEILRSTLFTGFPWNLIGYSMMFSDFSAQSASIIGIYGLSFIAILSCLIPVAFLDKAKSSRIFFIILATIFVSNFSLGYLRIKNTELMQSQNTVRLVQANIEQDLKWDANQKYQNFLKHVDLSTESDNSNLAAVIWSETSIPYLVDNSPELIKELQVAIPQKGVLITGGLRSQKFDGGVDFFNSVFSIAKNGDMKYYDKHHLVPFGEYVPFAKFLPFIEKITGGGVGFGEGKGPQTLVSPDFSFSPLICYEAIFSDKIIDRKNRPDLLVNVTNDAWFGKSLGPFQHFNMTRMRAIEYGLSMARVANSGITAYIDPFGRVVKKIDLNQEGVIDVNLIEKLSETIFSHFKYFVLLLILVPIALLLILRIKHHKK